MQSDKSGSKISAATEMDLTKIPSTVIMEFCIKNYNDLSKFLDEKQHQKRLAGFSNNKCKSNMQHVYGSQGLQERKCIDLGKYASWLSASSVS